jgi:hypothetical protein
VERKENRKSLSHLIIPGYSELSWRLLVLQLLSCLSRIDSFLWLSVRQNCCALLSSTLPFPFSFPLPFPFPFSPPPPPPPFSRHPSLIHFVGAVRSSRAFLYTSRSTRLYFFDTTSLRIALAHTQSVSNAKF